MYRIIGADGRQYGPVSADQIKFWLASNRANSQTMAQAEGSSEWKPLSQFAEFSSVLTQTVAPPLLPAGDELKSKLAKVTAAEVRSAARDFFRSDRINVALVSPLKRAERLTRLLNL